VGDAVAALAADPGAQILAGGTDFMVEVNEGRRVPTSVVATRGVAALNAVEVGDTEVRIGAGVTYRELLEPPLADLFPALAQAARTVGSPQIRNAGTIGGNVATASPAGDTLPVLAALDAMIDVAGPGGRRTLPLPQLITGPKVTSLGPTDVIVAVVLPRRRGGQEFLKVGVRNAMVISVAGVAMVADQNAGRVAIALGSVGPVPLRCASAEEWLASRVDWSVGRFADPALDLAPLAALVSAAARPIDDHRSTSRYRSHAVGVLARRAAVRIFGPGQPPGPADGEV
jgi:CO/xanthine dehydrogenase FAD-binding subunit